ncbi:YiiX/YebB-like N1pC/P60 family cysteine hydrolase [Dysgonomonas sp. 511]|uniref:YiiX/YebB-like N1pC/P60 family cysteine hydrolase n=1 Tax=Dysgonomonas sp. 511 TaxID=2302930 RepID=UPI0013CF8C3B|nr:YiiX/YebB-like N1pC/P60 family cysteine hydrolase [Dysgonomonas sp. 511]NDV78063.1 hypothetical protein [Dysgonomonas sp. 511]
MESKYGNEKIVFLVFSFILFLSACGSSPKEEQPLNLSPEISNGDIVCRMGNGFFSNRFKDFSSREKIYSHAGIVEQVGDSLFVIHAEASELTGIGFVKREPISVFLDGIKTWGVYRVAAADSIRHCMASIAKGYYQRHTPFDLDFDAADDSKVYCTELVALAVNKAFGYTVVKPELNLGKLKIYGIDNVYLLPGTTVVQKVTE